MRFLFIIFICSSIYALILNIEDSAFLKPRANMCISGNLPVLCPLINTPFLLRWSLVYLSLGLSKNLVLNVPEPELCVPKTCTLVYGSFDFSLVLDFIPASNQVSLSLEPLWLDAGKSVFKTSFMSFFIKLATLFKAFFLILDHSLSVKNLFNLSSSCVSTSNYILFIYNLYIYCFFTTSFIWFN